MPFPHLLTLWIVSAAVSVIIALRKGKGVDASLFGVAFLTATTLTALAALYPLAQTPGWLGILVSWIRNFLVYTILLELVSKSRGKESRQVNLKSGLVFATLLAIFELI